MFQVTAPLSLVSWILFDFYERQEQQSHLLSFFISHILILVFPCCFLLLCFREVTKPTNLRKEETLTRFLNSKRERDQVEKMLAIGSPNYSVRTSTSCNALLRELQVFPLSCFLFTSFLWVSSSFFWIFSFWYNDVFFETVYYYYYYYFCGMYVKKAKALIVLHLPSYHYGSSPSKPTCEMN